MVANEILEPCGLTTKSFVGWLKWVKENRIKKGEQIFYVYDSTRKKYLEVKQ